MKKFFDMDGRPAAAIFMSGSGSNAERLLEFVRDNDASWVPAVIVTDNPEKSRAREIAATFSLPLLEHDIHGFYKAHGEARVSLKTERGREIRSIWTDELRKKLLPYGINFGILAGFIPLSNITSDFPCLNVHPGDLTVEREGRRILAGLHTIPIENAIIAGLDTIRSSVIIAQPYTGAGGEMDSGPILGISEALPIDFMGHERAELKAVYNARPALRPAGGFKDILEEVAAHNQDRLKVNGDWLVFPPAVNDFAASKFTTDGAETLFFEGRKVKTVVYGRLSKAPVFL